MAGILVYALHYGGHFNKNALGALSEASRLAGELGTEAHAVVVGGDDLTDDFCASLGEFGAAKVFRVRAEEGIGGPVVDAMAQIMGSGGHDYAMFGGGLLGFEVGAADAGVDTGRVGADGSMVQCGNFKAPPSKSAGEIIEDEDTNETVERIVAWLDERKLI